MTRTALILEIEGLLFDTQGLRTHALRQALEDEGVTAKHDDVARAHAGRPATLALSRLAAAVGLDAVGRELVVRRAGDAVTASIARGAPSFDPRARDALEAVAADFPLAVVTCAAPDDARHLLELAGLDAFVTTIRSIAETPLDEQYAAWAHAQRRLHADRGVAFAPGPLLYGAGQAGLTTVLVGVDTGDASDSRLVSLADVDAMFIASLFRAT